MPKKARKTHILIIRLSAMGDVAMTVPVILALHKQYPEAEITVLTKPHFASIFDQNEGVTVFPVETKSHHKGIFGLFKLFYALRKQDITHVADLHQVLRSTLLGLFFRVTGTPVKRIKKGREEKKALTREKNKKFQPLKHTVIRYFEVFKALGFPLEYKEGYHLPKAEWPQGIVGFLQDADLKVVGIAPFAAHMGKMYRLNLVQQVVELLLKRPKTTVLLFGGGSEERKALEAFASKFGSRVVSVVGKTDFKGELALISNLDVMLAMDSGNGHLAANYGVPVVTIWGVTHPHAGFSPYGQQENRSLLPDRKEYPLIPTSVYGNKCPEEYLEAINSIPPKDVAEKVLQVLERGEWA